MPRPPPDVVVTDPWAGVRPRLPAGYGSGFETGQEGKSFMLCPPLRLSKFSKINPRSTRSLQAACLLIPSCSLLATDPEVPPDWPLCKGCQAGRCGGEGWTGVRRQAGSSLTPHFLGADPGGTDAAQELPADGVGLRGAQLRGSAAAHLGRGGHGAGLLTLGGVPRG